ncbi:MAG: cardiolipin synthase [Thermoanaerobaculia bacterium]
MTSPGGSLLGLILLACHFAGFLCSIHALMSVRTPQGTIAWVVSLITLPYVAVPAYLVLGRTKFHGYVVARQVLEASSQAVALAAARPFVVEPPQDQGFTGPAVALATIPFLRGNHVDLLVDGQATFDSLFAGIDEARRYILVQFFIVHDDELGRELKARLLRKAAEGVRVHFLFDEVGSRGLAKRYLRDLREGGVQAVSFHTTRGPGNRFQLNFRNHRKVVVVDGRTGWIGGHNVGDEYLGKSPRLGPWRDTHVKVTGPAVLGMQRSFHDDWRWATARTLDLDWIAQGSTGGDGDGDDNDVAALILASGPADPLETASLMFQAVILSARRRVWITSPYFVPDPAVTSAIHLAALRGVEVRILIPNDPDHLLVFLSAFAFVGEMIDAGVEIYRYQAGFLHQKVFLVDDAFAGVGTANLDNRSFRLNFEITAIFADPGVASRVEEMLAADFSRARRMTRGELREKPVWFKLAARAAYLASPIQ